jgi:hypothetical protein
MASAEMLVACFEAPSELLKASILPTARQAIYLPEVITAAIRPIEALGQGD